LGASAGYAVDKFAGGNGWVGAGVGAGLAFGATFVPYFNVDLLLGKGTLTAASMVVHVGEAAAEIAGNKSPGGIAATRTNPLIIEETTVYWWGELTDLVMDDPGNGKVQTGEQVIQDGNPREDGIILRHVSYNGPTVYGGFNRTETEEFVPPAHPSTDFDRPRIDIPTFQGRINTPGRIKMSINDVNYSWNGNTAVLNPLAPEEADNLRVIAGLLNRHPRMTITLSRTRNPTLNRLRRNIFRNFMILNFGLNPTAASRVR